MDEPFDLPIVYKNKQLHFPAQLQHFGYTHKFKVEVEGYEIFFEPDEERNYRALVNPEELNKMKVDVELLQTIAEAIESL